MMKKSLISYKLGDNSCVIPLDSIVEIYRMVAFTPFDNTSKRVVGHCSFRGQTFFGIDIQDIFGMQEHVFGSEANVIITSQQNYLFGILVDSIGQIIRLDETQEIVRNQFPPNVSEEYVHRAYAIDEQVYFEIDLLGLFTDDEKFQMLEHSSLLESTISRLDA